MNMQKYGPYAALYRMLRRGQMRIEKALDIALRTEANLWANEMRKTIVMGQIESLEKTSDITKHLKRTTPGAVNRPLMMHKSLLRGLKANKLAPQYYLAGIDARARGPRGQSVAEYADVQEFGRKAIIQTVSEDQALLFSKLKFLGLMALAPTVGQKIILRVPERSFARVVHRNLAPKSADRVWATFQKHVKFPSVGKPKRELRPSGKKM